MAETMAVYLATGLRQGEAEPEEDEVIEIRMMPLPTALQMVLAGKIRDGKTIASVLWLDHALRMPRPSHSHRGLRIGRVQTKK